MLLTTPHRCLFLNSVSSIWNLDVFIKRCFYKNNEERTIAPNTRDQNFIRTCRIQSHQGNSFLRHLPLHSRSHSLFNIHSCAQSLAYLFTDSLSHSLALSETHTNTWVCTHTYTLTHSHICGKTIRVYSSCRKTTGWLDLRSQVFDDAITSRKTVNYLSNYSIINKSHHKKLS